MEGRTLRSPSPLNPPLLCMKGLITENANFFGCLQSQWNAIPNEIRFQASVFDFIFSSFKSDSFLVSLFKGVWANAKSSLETVGLHRYPRCIKIPGITTQPEICEICLSLQ